ncbi:hypothetical protein Q4489_16335 [Thalassotalea sp. 1_MG-2023]|uniref:hypothetical protein n=1 Tax=Thalassotalea sp. 1_MG-2023 TaxID=3062680 RepID=UPI0026E125AA|nr:hypothetical protein [Thalassotalea sp. 1_MG-2023]MDO6428582.1 hypothetical protein [Thalassotalea sp. 1_MG-2023]
MAENKSAMHTEWQLLQNQCDSYEKHALLIKLVCIFMLFIAFVFNEISMYLVLFILLMWGQESIWKTYQSRIEQRIITLEQAIVDPTSSTQAYQYQREFLANRPSQLTLIKTYLQQSIRPTVAYTYLGLLLIVFIRCYLW